MTDQTSLLDIFHKTLHAYLSASLTPPFLLRTATLLQQEHRRNVRQYLEQTFAAEAKYYQLS